MRSWGGSYGLAAGTGAAFTAGSFPLLTIPVGPLWVGLALLAFGLAMVTTATVRDASEARRARDAQGQMRGQATGSRHADGPGQPGVRRVRARRAKHAREATRPVRQPADDHA